MGRGQMNDRLVLDTKFGKLVCEVVRDDEYKEFAIDLYRNDGKAVQVAVIGTDEGGGDTDMDRIHTYLWDGENADGPDACYYTEPFGEGWWGEEEA